MYGNLDGLSDIGELQQVMDADETVLWTGRPHFLAFLLTGISFLLVGGIWLVFYLSSGILDEVFSTDGPSKLFFLLHSFPIWGSVLNIFRLMLVHRNEVYAITNKRVAMQSGFWGLDYQSIDFDKIQDIQVNVGPVAKYLGVGNIYISSAGSDGVFLAIHSPYNVYKKLKTVSVDVKTDWNFPNAQRPGHNPGYGTQYGPRKLSLIHI